MAGKQVHVPGRSGRHGLKHRLTEMGFSFTDERFARLYEEFLLMADTKKEVVEEDLRELVRK